MKWVIFYLEPLLGFQKGTNMQKYKLPVGDNTYAEAYLMWNNALESLRTCFSGSEFPTDLEIGQLYYLPEINGKGKVYMCYKKDVVEAQDAFVLWWDFNKTPTTKEDLLAHISNEANPHKVTASQVGTYDKAALDAILANVASKNLSNVALTSYPVMVGATPTANGKQGFIPAPTTADTDKFLRGDGTYVTIKQGFDGFPVGYRMDWDGDVIPSNWQEEDGGILNRADYPELWSHINSFGKLVTEESWVNNQLYGKFSAGNGTTTFRKPDRRDRYTKYGTTNIGKYEPSAAPEIQGTFRKNGRGALEMTGGSFTNVGNGACYVGTSGGWSGPDSFEFKASLSNAIYGRANVIRPETIISRSIIKVR